MDTVSTFDVVATISDVTLLRNAINLGKGAALKHGFNYILVHFPEAQRIITADADGQHDPDDIISVANASEDGNLVLGSRTFGPAVPLRSKFGNVVSRHVYGLATGIRLRDTQTGLRSVPRKLAEQCLTIDSNRYEFETEQLVKAKSSGLGFTEFPIKTVYFEDNRESHFNPIVDSFRIYFVLLRYAGSSIAAVLTDLILFQILIRQDFSILSANMIGLAAAIVVQYLLLRQFVFKAPGAGAGTFFFFVLYTIASRFVSAAVQTELLQLFPIAPVAVKIVSDFAIFLVNFLFLRDFVFGSRRID
jgi:putative flippase GtrA